VTQESKEKVCIVGNLGTEGMLLDRIIIETNGSLEIMKLQGSRGRILGVDGMMLGIPGIVGENIVREG